jgi:hypothetical protein
MDECMEFLFKKLNTEETNRRMDTVVDNLFAKLLKRMYPFIIVSSLSIVLIVLLMLYTCFNVKQIKKK